MELEKLKKFASEGKVYFGLNSARFYSLNGEAKGIFAAKNAKKEFVVEIENNCKRSNINFEVLDIDSEQLGIIFGKPFRISFVTIV